MSKKFATQIEDLPDNDPTPSKIIDDYDSDCEDDCGDDVPLVKSKSKKMEKFEGGSSTMKKVSKIGIQSVIVFTIILLLANPMITRVFLNLPYLGGTFETNPFYLTLFVGLLAAIVYFIVNYSIDTCNK